MENKEVLEGKWQLSFVSGICIGIETVLSESNGEKYSMAVLNTILPDSDKEYKKQKKEIEGTMQHICDLHNNWLSKQLKQ